MERNSSTNKNGSLGASTKVFVLPDGNIFLLTTLQTQSIVSSMYNPQSQNKTNFPGEIMPTFAGLHTRRASSSEWHPPYKRCQLCRCPILQTESDAIYCPGCVVDHMHPIQNILRKKGYEIRR